jgi:hypothetical protein
MDIRDIRLDGRVVLLSGAGHRPLASEQAGWITGQILSVDGGRL